MTVATEWDDLALGKLQRILGVPEGNAIFAQALTKCGLPHLGSATDVYRFAECLKLESPVVAAIGAMLSLSAVMKGADTSPSLVAPA